MNRPVLLPLVLLAVAPALAGAQELRSIIAGTVSLAAERPEGERLSMGYADAVAVFYPKESPFIQGFEIELKSPQAALAAPNSLFWEVWQKVEPEPDRNRFSYAGERLLSQSLPARLSLVLQFPVRPDHSLKSGPYATVLPLVVTASRFPFVFRLQPITKGLSGELESAQFQVTVKPLLRDEGGLRLNLRFPEGLERQPLSISIDGSVDATRFMDGKEILILPPGTHFLRVASDVYRDENRSFTVERGKVAELAIELQDTAPLLAIEAPDSALVSLDGARVDHLKRPSFTVEPGEHTVSCRIGDYSVQRRFTAFRGKTYRIVLLVDLLVQEGQ